MGPHVQDFHRTYGDQISSHARIHNKNDEAEEIEGVSSEDGEEPPRKKTSSNNEW